jgi:hypothetical protein
MSFSERNDRKLNVDNSSEQAKVLQGVRENYYPVNQACNAHVSLKNINQKQRQQREKSSRRIGL